MTDTTTLIQRLREDLPKVNEPESQFSCVATPDIRQAADALEQQAAQIKALRADAERMTTALNKIAERQNSDWPDRCQALVNIARAALRQEGPKP